MPTMILTQEEAAATWLKFTEQLAALSPAVKAATEAVFKIRSNGSQVPLASDSHEVREAWCEVLRSLVLFAEASHVAWSGTCDLAKMIRMDLALCELARDSRNNGLLN